MWSYKRLGGCLSTMGTAVPGAVAIGRDRVTEVDALSGGASPNLALIFGIIAGIGVALLVNAVLTRRD
jgi:hypothetical protein